MYYYKISVASSLPAKYCSSYTNPTPLKADFIEIWQSSCCPDACNFENMLIYSSNGNHNEEISTTVKTTNGVMTIHGWRFDNLNIEPGLFNIFIDVIYVHM